MSAGPSSYPAIRLWSRGVSIAVALLAVIAGLIIVISWYEASGTVRVERQIDWGIVAVAGAGAVCVAMVLWILAGRRAVAFRLHQITAVLDSRTHLPSTETSRSASPSLVATTRMSRYHLPWCPLAARKPVRAADRAEHEAAGRRPCGVCQP
jgi:hypothetical protein